MDTVENTVKMCNQSKRKVELCKGLEERPTYLAKLGTKLTWKHSRPNQRPTRRRRWRGGPARVRAHPLPPLETSFFLSVHSKPRRPIRVDSPKYSAPKLTCTLV